MILMRQIDKEAEDREIVWEPDGRWWIGKMNLLASVNDDLLLPEKLHIVDATLREGEEVPDTFLSEDEKVELANLIYATGFTELEVGYAGIIQEHFNLVRRLVREGFPGKISSHTRIYGRPDEWRTEIDRNLEAGAQILTMVGFATEVGTATTPWILKDEVADRISDCVSYAKAQGGNVTFGLADLVRTDFKQIVDCYRAATEAGVDRVYIYDGMGAARPETVRFLTRFVRDLVGDGVEIGVHVHDTFGLSHANAISALTSGASAIDAVPLGLGDGSGITASEEVASAMEILYGVKTSIHLDQLRSLCQQVAKLFGISMPKTKAVVGDNTYTHQIDSHIAAILRGAWYSWEIARPEVLGHTRRLEFGHAKLRNGRSGAIAALLDMMGLTPSDDELAAILDDLRAETMRRPSLDVEEVKELIRRVIGERESKPGEIG